MTNEEAIRRLECMDSFLQTRCNDYSERDHDAFLLAIKALENERPKGEWIDLGYALEEYRAWGKCSACGDGMFQSDFCPNCGADMKEVDDDTN